MRRFSILLILTLGVLLGADAALAGVYYKAESVIEPDNGQSQRMDVEAWVDGEKAKIVFTESTNPMTPEGSYLLTTDGGQVLYLVNPEEKTYTEWDLAAMMQTLGAMMDSMGGMMTMEFSEPEVEKLLEEGGGSMLGMDTTHYRYRTTYTMKLKVMGIRRNNTTETVQDLWTTDEMDEAALGVWLRSTPPRTGNEDIDQLVEAELDKIQGFPLKTVTVSTTTGEKQKRSTTTRSTTEVTVLERRDVPAGSFEIPAGYEEREMMPQTEEEGESNPLKGLFGGG
ncbi:MAG: DUF4412 domain-containing protein [Acidobacteriota bacterium]|nr:DUF4412 domain-containing protein [Acidobacteriota bacterium]